jgi:exodeoxyribonuclease V alpha subunit
MQTEPLMQGLENWVTRGWMRSLDLAFVRFLMKEAPAASAEVLLAAALVSHQLGRGHICLDVQAVLDDPTGVLALPPEGEDVPSGDLLEVLSDQTRESWEKCLRESPIVFFSERVDVLELPSDASSPEDKMQEEPPLVMSSGRLYLRRYWRYMQQVAQGISRRVAEAQRPMADAPDNLKDRLSRMFHISRTAGKETETGIHWQRVAVAIAANSAFTVISGGPGTGKTTTVVELLTLLQEVMVKQGRPLRISLAAPTGKAAARLTESIGSTAARLAQSQGDNSDARLSEIFDRLPMKATTLHRLLGSRPDSRRFVHHARNPLHVDLLIVDEASMIDLEMMASLLEALPSHARLVLLGDKDQLASVEAGSVLGDICAHAEKPRYLPETIDWLRKHTGYDLADHAGDGTKLDQHIVVLRQSRRFGTHSGIGELARAVNAGDPTAVNGVWNRGFGDISRLNIQSLDDERFSRLVLDGYPAGFSGDNTSEQAVGYRTYLEIVRSGPPPHVDGEDDWLRNVLAAFGRFQLIAAVRKGRWGVEGLNEKTATLLHSAGLIPATEGWYPGRPVMVIRNDYNLGLMNGDVGIVLPVSAGANPAQKKNRVVFLMPDGSLKKVLPSRLADVETVYAMTVHKSQGSEFQHTAMVLPDAMNPVLTRELVYTGITRARNWFTLVCPSPAVLEQAVERRMHRASGLGELLSGKSGDLCQ